jgi:ubiquinone/menaquinone biosynthesis C-methylase UbiE
MDAAVHRPAEAEGGKPVSQISPRSESGDLGLSGYSAAPKVATYVSVAEGYERWAPTYDQAPNPLLNLEARKVATLLPNLSGKRVLDLACGTGRWLERISAQGADSAIGVDLSAAMLRVAEKKPAIGGRLAQADCLNLPFRSAVFDLVVCSFAVGHIPDLGAMVRELARVTKRGADVFVSDLHPEAYARGWRTGFRDSRSAVQIEMSPRTAEEIIRAFYAEGFECLTHVPLCLGKPERRIFAQAGKSHLFTPACQVPAVLVCHFRLRSAES